MRTKRSGKNKLIRVILSLVFLLILLTAAFGIATAVKFNSSEKSSERAVIEQTVAISETKNVTIGKNIQANALVKIPWGRQIIGFEVTPGKGAQLAGTPSYHRQSIGWGYSIWRLNARFHAFRPGEIPSGSMLLLLEGGAEKRQELSMILPAFQAVSLPVSELDEPVAAGKIIPPAPKSVPPLTIAILILAGLLLVLIWILFRRKGGKADSIPAWVLALDSIRSLRGELHSGRANAAKAIVSLTDVMRAYLELRFHLRAEHQTTREFLDELYKGGPLDSKQNLFLKDFLQSADLVKFAKAPANVMLFDDAADRAEILVRETSASQEEKEKEVLK